MTRRTKFKIGDIIRINKAYISVLGGNWAEKYLSSELNCIIGAIKSIDNSNITACYTVKIGDKDFVLNQNFVDKFCKKGSKTEYVLYGQNG